MYSDGISNCPHCGMIHMYKCPLIKSIEYYPNGGIKKIQFHESSFTNVKELSFKTFPLNSFEENGSLKYG